VKVEAVLSTETVVNSDFLLFISQKTDSAESHQKDGLKIHVIFLI
jgi:hypothetical protein